MEGTINGSSHFHRVDALLNHQPIKLELFKDFLQRENVGQHNDARNTGTSKPDNGMTKETPGSTYVYYDYSTMTNDNSIHFTDKSHLSMKEAANPPKEQEENPPASAKASATQHQNVTTVPEKQSDRSTDGRRDSGRQKRPEVTPDTSDITVNSNKPSNETLTPPVTVGGHAGVDDIDGPALPTEASSTPETNAELNVRTSVPQAQPERVGNPGSSMAARQTSFIGPFSTGITGAAQFQKYKQSSDSGRVDKKKSLQLRLLTMLVRRLKVMVFVHVMRMSVILTLTLRQEKILLANQALHAASFTRQRAQFATTLTKAKSNAAIVQSSEPRSQEGASPSLNPYIGPNRTGRTGAAEFKRYWQPAKKRLLKPIPRLDAESRFQGVMKKTC
ncbi:hypothetical protein CS369_14165 [Candidatus Symbiopectobacterium sp. 'North America']|uniref:hypothetical protein n=1 Tax=Candidatus Symbiopectobacterium sp. 'North America' TaxID=2794574 RepID=UPI0018CB669C|nr:hypothetical protein [Candidatus Symbiopectobacterium sp. 'North America']MBG6245637.1 hypothetical protein [Candidatus Symbiopectobacterium sp. 'North America']